tara:strand:+ start:1373 stop:1831 length:459 start_codon:yes stop_codon:yes gene_type:complete
MINFENFHKIRHTLSGFEEYKIVNSLLKSFADARVNDITISEPKFSNCYYDKEWVLDFIKNPVDIFEYSFNCLRIYLTYNHEELENAKFFRSIDLFYKYLSQYFKLNKREWLDKIYVYAQKSEHHKAPVFIKNMDQYLEKQKIMDDMKCLIK